MEKLKIDEIVVVEGKDDIAALSKVIDATIIAVNGSSGLSLQVIEKLKNLSANNKMIILTDPDFTGKKIREKINLHIQGAINLHISREEGNKKGNIGVENATPHTIYTVFKEYLDNREDSKSVEKYEYTIEHLIDVGLVGNDEAKLRREKLGNYLRIGYYNAKSLLKVLNGMNLDYERFNEAIMKMENNGIVFGKFIPAHKGHIHFIKEVAKTVDNLYVLMGVEKARDEELLAKSTLPKHISEEDRMHFLQKELVDVKNVKIYVLREEGINYYPNGWQDWTNRVADLLKEEKIYISKVFTNEIQDKENYIKYFTDEEVFSDKLEVVLIDPDRFSFNVSATKIRTDYEKYKEYLPDSVREFLY